MSEIAEATAPKAARLPRDARYFELKREVEEFLYDEANLLDERQFREWLDTLAPDLEYFMPMTFNVKFGDHAARENTTREKHMSWFNEGRWTLAKRVDQIMTGVQFFQKFGKFREIITAVGITHQNILTIRSFYAALKCTAVSFAMDGDDPCAGVLRDIA